MLDNVTDLRTYFTSSEKDKRAFNKATRRRARYGLAWCDTWNFDRYLLTIIIRGLRQLGENTHGCPINMEYEEWQRYLYSLADKFDNAQRKIYDDECCYSSLAAEEMIKTNEEGMRELKEAFAELAEHLPEFWD